MTDVAVVTANLGDLDEPHGAVEQTIAADWYYVVDDDSTLVVPEPWNIVRVPVDSENGPRIAAKRYRMVPWLFLEKGEDADPYDYYVWLDSSMEVISSRFLEEAIAATAPRAGLLDGAPLAAWRHPRRDCIYEELEWSFREAPEKYEPHRDAMTIQVAGYDLEGYPPHSGLYATGTLVWNYNAPKAVELGGDWLEETVTHSVQDQLSLPVVAWRLGVPVATFPYEQVPARRRRYVRDPFSGKPKAPEPVDYIENRWVRIHPHRRMT